MAEGVMVAPSPEQQPHDDHPLEDPRALSPSSSSSSSSWSNAYNNHNDNKLQEEEEEEEEEEEALQAQSMAKPPDSCSRRTTTNSTNTATSSSSSSTLDASLVSREASEQNHDHFSTSQPNAATVDVSEGELMQRNEEEEEEESKREASLKQIPVEATTTPKQPPPSSNMDSWNHHPSRVTSETMAPDGPQFRQKALMTMQNHPLDSTTTNMTMEASSSESSAMDAVTTTTTTPPKPMVDESHRSTNRNGGTASSIYVGSTLSNPWVTKARLQARAAQALQPYQETLQEIYSNHYYRPYYYNNKNNGTSKEPLAMEPATITADPTRLPAPHEIRSQPWHLSPPTTKTTTTTTPEAFLQDRNHHHQRRRSMIVVSGPHGCGKRTLVQTALQPLVVEQHNGYLLQGHYDPPPLSCPGELQWQSHKTLQGGGGSIIPYSGLVMAFSSFTAQVIQRHSVKEVRQAILQYVSNTNPNHHQSTNNNSNNNTAANLSVLTSMIPALEGILEQDMPSHHHHPPSTQGGSSSSTNSSSSEDPIQRFVLAFRMFVRAITSLAPVVLVLHELQWADPCSLDLLTGIVTDHGSPDRRPPLLVVATLDWTLVAEDSYVARKLRELEQPAVVEPPTVLPSSSSNSRDKEEEKEGQAMLSSIHTVELCGGQECSLLDSTNRESSKNSEDVLWFREWLAQALEMDNADHAETLQRLMRLLPQHVPAGNWFLVMEFVHFLQESDLLFYRPFSPNQGRWELASPEELNVVLAHLQDHPGEFLVDKLQHQLSPPTKQVLMVAACLGSRVNVRILEWILGANVAEQLDELEERGWLARNKLDELPSTCYPDHNPMLAATTTTTPTCRKAWQSHEAYTFEHMAVREAAQALIARSSTSKLFSSSGGLSVGHDSISSPRSDSSSSKSSLELFHLEIGRKLWKKLSSLSDNDDALSQHVFVVLSQMSIGRQWITNEKECVATATLCLLAGQKAARSSTFRTAAVYLKMGLELLYNNSHRQKHRSSSRSNNNNNSSMNLMPDDEREQQEQLAKGNYCIVHSRCWRDHYDLSLALHSAAAEMTMASADFDATNLYIECVLENAQSLDDKVQAYTTKMLTLSQQDQHNECIDLGIWLLKQWGETFPSRLCMAHLGQEMRSVERLLRNKSNEQILRMPSLTDANKLRALQVLGFMIMATLSYRPKMSPFVMLKMMKITLQHGLSVFASSAFGVYGMLCICLYCNVEKATRFADLALILLDRYAMMEYMPRVHAAVYGCVHAWTKPIQTALEPLLHAHRVGMQIGDAEYGGLCANLYCFYAMDSGCNLGVIQREWNGFKESLVTAKQAALLRMVSPFMQSIHHLMGLTDDPLASKGDLLDFDEFEQACMQRGAFLGICSVRTCRMQLAYIFGDINMAERFCLTFQDVMLTPPSFERATYVFYIGVVAVAIARKELEEQGGNSTRNQGTKGKRYWSKHRNWKNAKQAEKMLMRYARSSPVNCLDKSHLLQAELSSLQGDHCKAYEKYLIAIALSAENGHLMIHALSNELLARHLLRITSTAAGYSSSTSFSRRGLFGQSGSYWSSSSASSSSFSIARIRDQTQKAKECLERAIRSYQDWGGMAVVRKLQSEFASMLGTAEDHNSKDTTSSSPSRL